MDLDELRSRLDERSGLEALEAYLEVGGDVNAPCNELGWTLLHLAVEHQNLALIRMLVDMGADVELRAADGWRPIHLAADIDVDSVWQSTHSLSGVTFQTTALLLQLGADPRGRAEDGTTVRDQVVEYCEDTAPDSQAMLARLDALLREGDS